MTALRDLVGRGGDPLRDSSASSSPSSALARAAAPLMRPSQRTTDTGTRSPDTGKLSTALRVSPPHSSSVVSRVMHNASAAGAGRETL